MTASTVAQYLAALPADRRAALSAVRKAINENLPDGYEEGMQFGMIGWYVPLSMYPAGYGENPKVPLPLVALASQKSGMVLHFLCFYGHPTLSTWFTSGYKKSGKKLDMDGLAAPGSGKRLGGRRPMHQTDIPLPTAQIRFHLSGDGVTLAAASKDPWRYSGLPAASRITVNWVAPA